MNENLRILLRRSSLILLAVGVLSSVGVYLGHGWFHGRLLPALGVGAALGDALGGFAIILVAYAGQRLVSLAMFRDIDFGMLRTLGGMLRENRAIRQELDVLDRQASHDKLTGCWNRHRLEEVVRAELDRLTRYDQALSLLVVDIDHFKRVNDRHGHPVGDKILAELAAHLRGSLRPSDSLTRWGGEEFVVLCPNTSLGTALVLAERLRQKVAAHDFETADPVSISIGVAECGAEESWDAWFARADAALYRAKHGGRNRVECAPETRELGRVLPQAATAFVKLAWHPAYACGNATIDEEHQVLFALANELLNTLIAARPVEETRSIIDVMMREIERHFAHEEAILKDTDYHGLAEHAALHRQLLEKGRLLSERLRTDPQSVGELFQYLAHDVVAKHLLAIDREYFPYLPVVRS